MSLIADALKKAQASRLTRRYRTGEPTAALPVVEEKKRGGFRESISSLMKGRRLSPTLGIGLACAFFKVILTTSMVPQTPFP